MQRLNYIDRSKGIAILIVVIGHIIQYNTLNANNNPICNVIRSCQMPIFFFLSGYVLAVSGKNYFSFKFIKSRFQLLLFPFFIWEFIKIFFFQQANINVAFPTVLNLIQEPDLGYWYLIVLFCISVVFYLYQGMSKINFRLFDYKINPYLVLIIDVLIIGGILFIETIFYNKYGTIYLAPMYWRMFFIGYLYSKFFSKIDISKYLFILFICFALTAGYFHFEIATNTIILYTITLSSSLFIINFCRSDYLFEVKFPMIERALQLFGKNSLQIYILHFFIVNFSSIYLFKYCDIPLFFIFCVIAFIIAYICCFLSQCIETVSYASMILFGRSPNKKKISS